MTKEELNKIFENIQLQMIYERNSGYRNEYSKSLQERMSLYNYIIDLKNVLNEIKEIIKENKNDLDYEPWSTYKVKGKTLFDILQIIDKLGDEK